MKVRQQVVDEERRSATFLRVGVPFRLLVRRKTPSETADLDVPMIDRL
jgi:hypothetical protein